MVLHRFVDYREPFDSARKYVPKLNCSCTTYFQEDIMAEARQVEADAATYLDQISRYFITRGKIISKVAKYPHVVSVHVNRCTLSAVVAQARCQEVKKCMVFFWQEDYRRTVKELDEKEFVSIRLVVHELRNHYVSSLGFVLLYVH